MTYTVKDRVTGVVYRGVLSFEIIAHVQVEQWRTTPSVGFGSPGLRNKFSNVYIEVVHYIPMVGQLQPPSEDSLAQ